MEPEAHYRVLKGPRPTTSPYPEPD